MWMALGMVDVYGMRYGQLDMDVVVLAGACIDDAR